MTNEDAYKACVELCKEQGWWATHTALTEDGYDPDTNFINLYELWKADVQ